MCEEEFGVEPMSHAAFFRAVTRQVAEGHACDIPSLQLVTKENPGETGARGTGSNAKKRLLQVNF